MNPRTGRPKSDNPRRNVVGVRLTDDEHALVKAAAETAGLTISDYLRAKGVAAAKRQR